MHYLIDGHNLIGRMPDIALDDPHDEVELVLRLRSWAARSRKRRVTVVFDRGLPGGADQALSTGDVKVIFAGQGQSADQMLINRIQRARNPREYTVVSSDNHIIRSAEARRMAVLRAGEFALKLAPLEDNRAAPAIPDADPLLDEDELAMWLDLFDGSEE